MTKPHEFHRNLPSIATIDRRHALKISAAFVSAIALPIRAQTGPSTIKIGLLGALSTFNGEDNRKMTQMAVDEINRAGGIMGHQIDLIELDSEGDAAKSIQGLQYLYNTKKVDCVVGGYFSGPVLALLPYISRNKLPYICTGAASPKITESGNKYLFRTWPHSVQQVLVTAKALNEVLHRKHNLKNCALLLEDYAWTKGEYSDALEKKLHEYGMQTSLTIRYDPKTKDFSSIFRKVQDAKSQILVPASSVESGYTLVKQWGAMKLPMPLFGNVNAAWVLDKFWDATDGNCQYSTEMGGDRPALSQKTHQVWDTFRKLSGHAPYFTSLYAYDAIFILKNAMESAGATSGDSLISALKKTHYLGAAGMIEFDSTNQLKDALLPFSQWQITKNATNMKAGTMAPVWPDSLAVAKYQLPPWI